MAAIERAKMREAFSRRLSEALDERDDVPRVRSRRAWVAKKWGVSVETARKWLTGLDMPDRAHLAAICTDLQVSPDWMLTGLGRKYLIEEDDDLLNQLIALWRELPSELRAQVVEFARFLAEKARASPPFAADGSGAAATPSLTSAAIIELLTFRKPRH